uniref:Ig-like domain-containing protein n=1 Tax=Hucho hucho TaxID=62062 RepID=A0A4W5JX31_9TELE
MVATQTMFPEALLLLLAAASCVHCEELTQPASMTVQLVQPLTISCKVSYSLSSYWTTCILQPAGKALEWFGQIYNGNSLQVFTEKQTLDSSNKTVTKKGQNLQTEDTAVYFCARDSQ